MWRAKACGGRGGVVECYGRSRPAVAAAAFGLVASVQRSGGRAAVVDVAQALDLSAARSAGVETGALFVSQPSDGDEALAIGVALLRSNFFDIVLVDGAEALAADVCGEGCRRRARRLAKAVRAMAGECMRSGATCVFTRHSRPGGSVRFGYDACAAVAAAISSCATARRKACAEATAKWYNSTLTDIGQRQRTGELEWRPYTNTRE